MMSPDVRADVVLAWDKVNLLIGKISLNTELIEISGILLAALEKDESETRPPSRNKS